MAKTLTYEEYFKTRTTKELVKEALQLQEQIEIVECFGLNDLAMLDKINEELEKRETKEEE